MIPSELFNGQVMHSQGTGRSYGEWTYAYWECEFALADANELGFSHLCEYRDAKSRTCGICGKVHDTNPWGIVVYCDSEDCLELRSYFGYTSTKDPVLACGAAKSDRSKRAMWLKRMLMELYEIKTIHGLPLESRAACLYSMKLARMAHEHSSTQGVTEGANMQPVD